MFRLIYIHHLADRNKKYSHLHGMFDVFKLYKYIVV